MLSRIKLAPSAASLRRFSGDDVDGPIVATILVPRASSGTMVASGGSARHALRKLGGIWSSISASLLEPCVGVDVDGFGLVATIRIVFVLVLVLDFNVDVDANEMDGIGLIADLLVYCADGDDVVVVGPGACQDAPVGRNAKDAIMFVMDWNRM
mmetsp:Transcript_22496/g.38835  ORF Transcript_22496/g.38835 Transcript_22496/m.38835 type:complete len:154 (+) Transcript_22496:1277-1738(+)